MEGGAIEFDFIIDYPVPYDVQIIYEIKETGYEDITSNNFVISLVGQYTIPANQLLHTFTVHTFDDDELEGFTSPYYEGAKIDFESNDPFSYFHQYRDYEHFYIYDDHSDRILGTGFERK